MRCMGQDNMLARLRSNTSDWEIVMELTDFVEDELVGPINSLGKGKGLGLLEWEVIYSYSQIPT